MPRKAALVNLSTCFLGDGNPAQRAVPLETDPQAVITPALAQRKAFPLNRIYIRDGLS